VNVIAPDAQREQMLWSVAIPELASNSSYVFMSP